MTETDCICGGRFCVTMAALALYQRAVGSGRDGHQSPSGKAPPPIADSDHIGPALLGQPMSQPAARLDAEAAPVFISRRREAHRYARCHQLVDHSFGGWRVDTDHPHGPRTHYAEQNPPVSTLASSLSRLIQDETKHL